MEDVDLNNPMGSLMSQFTWSQILASFVFGVIGIYVFRRGKKASNWKEVFTGVAMMIYPMFTSHWIFDWGVGIGLCWLAHYFETHEDLTG